MPSLELYDFQSEASNQISARVVEYLQNPVSIGRGVKQRQLPFIQLLHSVTASGKTLVLADAVSSIAQQISTASVVLWLSRATVVVSQTFANLAVGGAYHELLDDFEVRTLADYDGNDLLESDSSFLFFATVGTFNQSRRAESSLNVFQSAIDEAVTSTWESLKIRQGPGNIRRKLIIVYDEAHNLSDQQTELLLELEPDAFILATATSRLPARLGTEVLSHLKSVGEYTDEELATVIDPSRVSRSGLIKSTLSLVGSQSSMESVLIDLKKALVEATKDAFAQGLSGRPKAVYVCKTNVSSLTGTRDNSNQPFNQRQAPPILIWRYLVEELKVPPSEIAVYCDLRVDRDFPLPSNFTLFKGGDKDYDQFVNGNYQHIVFNQSLQEGWDDPFVYFAYIDKSMGSKVQVEQVIGRLLRQPGRKHYPAQRLNTAEIFVRVDATGVFDEVVAEVDEKICSGNPEIKITVTKPGAMPPQELEPKMEFSVPVASIMTDQAVELIAKRVEQLNDYTLDSVNTKGTASSTRVQRVIGVPGAQQFRWEVSGETATVLARWLFQREVELAHKNALSLVLTSDAGGKKNKFDARVGFGSNAANQISEVARDIAHIYADEVYLKLRRSNPYEVGPILIAEDASTRFKNAVHSRYDGLNKLELQCAKSIDDLGVPWCRNPVSSGYKIPLIEPGRTRDFYPDFLIEFEGNIFALDTKGAHLHADAARKFVDIKPAGGSKRRVFVRFISDGRVTESGPQPNSKGYTAWTFAASGSPKFTYFDDMRGAISECLKPGI